MNAVTELNLSRVPKMSISGRNYKLFNEFIVEYIEKSRKSEAYKRMYKNVAQHITDFSGYSGQSIYTATMSEEILEEFVFFLQDKRKLMISTVKGLVERTKSMLQKACHCGYDVDASFRDFNNLN